MSEKNENQEKQENGALSVLDSIYTVSPDLLAEVGGNLVPLGTKISSSVVDVYKGTVGVTDRIAFIYKNPVAVKRHFFEDIGYIQCFGGACCELDPSQPQVRYVFPIIKYSSNPQGKVTANCKFEIMCLVAGKKLYDSIIAAEESLTEDGGDGIVAHDFRVTSKANGEYGTEMTLTPTPAKAHWLSRKDIIEDVKDKFDVVFKGMVKAVAKPITSDRFAELMGEAEPKDEIDAEIIEEEFYED